MLTWLPRFGQFCAVIALLALEHADMQSDMPIGEEASWQANSLLQAVSQLAMKFAGLLLLLPQPCDPTTTVMSASATTPPQIDHTLLDMLDWLLV